MERKSRIVDDFSGKITMRFNVLVYYHVHGLILAGTPIADISLVETNTPNVEAVIHVRGKPKIKIAVRYALEENMAYIDEWYYDAPQPTHLQAFLDSRKSPPPPI